MPESSASASAVATLAGGCFWCLEAVFVELAGVESVRSGYAGGHVDNPSYEQVCRGNTGHAEVVQVQFDPSVLSYHDLLQVFFSIHDPTTRDRQGHDVGNQYRSAIFAHDPEQRSTAEEVMREIEGARLFDAPLVTEVQPLDTFYPAEIEHDDYFARNPEQAYCRAVIAPKVAKFRQQHIERLKRAQNVPLTT